MNWCVCKIGQSDEQILEYKWRATSQGDAKYRNINRWVVTKLFVFSCRFINEWIDTVWLICWVCNYLWYMCCCLACWRLWEYRCLDQEACFECARHQRHPVWWYASSQSKQWCSPTLALVFAFREEKLERTAGRLCYFCRHPKNCVELFSEVKLQLKKSNISEYPTAIPHPFLQAYPFWVRAGYVVNGWTSDNNQPLWKQLFNY